MQTQEPREKLKFTTHKSILSRNFIESKTEFVNPRVLYIHLIATLQRE